MYINLYYPMQTYTTNQIYFYINVHIYIKSGANETQKYAFMSFNNQLKTDYMTDK